MGDGMQVPQPLLSTEQSTTTTTTIANSFYNNIHEQNNNIGYIRKSDLPQGNWMSLHESLEFLPKNSMMSPADESILLQRAMAQFGKPSKKNKGKVNIDHNHHLQSKNEKRKLEEGEDEPADEAVQEEDTPQYRVQPFVEGVSDYDEYQQAWRLLGFMIDCNSFSYYDAENNNNDNHGSHDQNDTGEGCARYVIWAAVRLF
jgi:hypothetical protein